MQLFFKLIITFKRLLNLLHTYCTCALFPNALVAPSMPACCYLPCAHGNRQSISSAPPPPPEFPIFLLQPRLNILQAHCQEHHPGLLLCAFVGYIPCLRCYVFPSFIYLVFIFLSCSFIWGSTLYSSCLRKNAHRQIF